MKRFFAGAAAVIFALGLTSLVLVPYASAAGGTVYANGTSRAYDGTNITRATNYLVVYTPAKGATTGTNSYGYEAAVVNDVVTTVQNGVGNMAIPSNGYVLSGHGTSRTWLAANVTVGQKVTLDGPPPPPPPSSSTVTINGQRHDITGTDISRAANALVMYTPAKGARTGTNQYGTEVTVVGGKVTAVANSVGNAVIPSDGYVLSGHGTSATWLQSNAPIGATVVLDDTNPLPVTEKLPDVGVQKLGQFSIVTASGKKLLKFPGVTFNIGTGPLEVNATRSSSTSTDWVGKQTVYMSDGSKTVLPDAGLQFYYAGDGHTHFHMRDFDAYELYDPSGKKLRDGEKHGFCFEDNTGYQDWRTKGTNGAPPAPVYTHAGSCGQGQPSTTSITHGLSVGWGDTYPTTLPDQGIDVTGMPDGNYTVVLTADQGGWIKESNESNNTATAHIRITGNTVTLVSTSGGL